MRSIVGHRLSGSWTWGFVSQAFSSATTFGLMLVAGRALGPAGLGVIVIGWSGYTLVLVFQRSLVTTPLVTFAAGQESPARTAAVRRALTVQLLGGTALMLVFFAGGWLPGVIGRALFLFAPWTLPVLLQNFWRSVLFQEKRAKMATINDAFWAAGVALAVPVSWFFPKDWAIVSCWGAGALAGAVLGFFQTGAVPVSSASALRWWRTNLWPFGRWLGVEGTVYSVLSSATTWMLVGILGPTALGGLRAAESLFAPMSVLLPAISLPGLPALTRAVAARPGAGFRLAWRLTGVVAVLAAAYVAVMGVIGGRGLSLLFGSSFARFATLLWPFAVWQFVAAAGVGSELLLRATRRGKAILAVRAAGSSTAFTLTVGLGWIFGVRGAAWGYAAGAAAATAVAIALMIRPVFRQTTDVKPLVALVSPALLVIRGSQVREERPHNDAAVGVHID